MKVTGSYDTDGNYQPYTKSVEVVQYGTQLIETETGMLWAIRDEYGDWVSPNLHGIGVKVKIEVEDTPCAPTP